MLQETFKAGYVQWKGEKTEITKAQIGQDNYRPTLLPRPVKPPKPPKPPQPPKRPHSLLGPYMSEFVTDPVYELINVNAFVKSVRSKRSPDEMNGAKVEDKHLMRGVGEASQKSLNFLNAIDKKIQTKLYDANETTLTEEDMVEQFKESVTPIRDNRFLNIFGFGTDNNRKASTKKFSKFSIGDVFNFGSGTGEIDEKEPSPKDNSDEKQNRRLGDFLGFSSGNSREIRSIETSSKIAVERIGKSSKNSMNNPTYFRESDTVTSKTARFFGSLFGSGNFGFLSEDKDRVTVAEKTTDESYTSKNKIPISESIQNISTEKNIEINVLANDVDFGSGQGMNFKSVENELYLSTIQSEEVDVNNFDVGVGSNDVELNSLKNASITFTNHQNNLTENRLNESVESHGRNFFANLFGCGRSFVKHPITRKCEPKITLHTVLRFPYEIYMKAFQNPENEMYREKIKESTEMMRLLLSDNPDLAERVTDFSVTGFSKGSLIVHWNLILAASENDTVINISRNVNKAINESLTRADVLMQAPLKIENVRILSVSLAIDPCQILDLNYCNRHADCTRDNYRPECFFCQCKPGAHDI